MVRLGYLLVLAGAALGAEPQYVGSKVCFGCHAEIYRSFTKTAMGRSMRPANDLSQTDVPLEAATPAAEGRVIRVFRDESGWYQSEEEQNVFVDKHKLDYIIGSGVNGLTPIVRRGDSLFQAPLSYYSKIGKWDLSPGYQHADLGFSRPVAQECVLCHSGRPAPQAGFHELAIGCENCHGPGEFHARQPNRQGFMVNPAKLTPRLAENICLNCHQGGNARILQPGRSYLDFRPGQWLIDTVAIFKIPAKTSDSDLLEHDSAMKLSRCFRGSVGKLSCLTCHDPHVEPGAAEAAAYFRGKCLSCHTDNSCRLPKTARSENCIGCHMPKRSVAVIEHSALTNHRIPARPDEAFPQAQPPDGNDLLLVNPAEGKKTAIPEITLLRAYSEVTSEDPTTYRQRYLELLDRLVRLQPAEPFVQAALGHKLLTEGKADAALPHLSLAMPLDDVTVYEDMAKALTALGRDEDAVACLKQASGAYPFNDVLIKTLTLQYIKLKRFAEAREQMQRYVELFPEDRFMRGLLTRVTN